MKLGLRLPVTPDLRVPHLHDLMALETPPASVDWQSRVAAWPMLLNDRLGDCGPAAIEHCIQQRLTYLGNPVVPTDAEVTAAYEELGGYNPNDPNTDQGVDFYQSMNMWLTKGVPGPAGTDTLVAYATIGHENPNWLEFAIWKFGGVHLAIQCPAAWADSDPQVFDVGPDGQLGPIAGGHWVYLCGYASSGLGMEYATISWGGVHLLTQRAARKATVAAACILDKDWLNASGVDPAGINWTAAEAAMKEIKGV